MDKVKKRWAPCYNRDTFLADMTGTQRGESMNNLMKCYMNATNSLLDFLKAFNSALEQRDTDLQLSKYRQNQFNVILKTTSPLEYQASEILTNYALKLTQEQLLQASSYSCIELFDARTETFQFFHVHRFGHEYESERKVQYDQQQQLFLCSCKHTTFSGIICRHIFRVALQLNLNKLPDSLFYQRWRKDPNNLILTQQFNLFCGNNLAINHSNYSEIEIEDYEYLLSKTLYEIKDLVKKYPELSKEFYFTNNTLLENKLQIIYNKKNNNTTLQNIINNPKKPEKTTRKKGIYNLLIIYNYIIIIYTNFN
jgi:hypothetical protein